MSLSSSKAEKFEFDFFGHFVVVVLVVVLHLSVVLLLIVIIIYDHGGIPEGGPRENPRSLSSPKAEKFEFDFFWTFWTEGGTEGGTDDGRTDGVTYTIRWSRIKMMFFGHNS